MKFFGCLFLVFIMYFLFFAPAHAASSESNHYAFCSGYAGKMHEVYRLKHYKSMQQYFDHKVGTDKDQLTSEYYQSGSEVVNDKLKISQNIKDKCEVLFKGKS